MLVVDDRADVRQAIADTFGHEAGFSVRGAGSIAEARRMLEDVDVAILDLSLPDGSGAELIPELHTVNPNAKALVFSFSVDPAVADHLLKRGAAAAVSKLDGVSELLETVKRIPRCTIP